LQISANPNQFWPNFLYANSISPTSTAHPFPCPNSIPTIPIRHTVTHTYNNTRDPTSQIHLLHGRNNAVLFQQCCSSSISNQEPSLGAWDRATLLAKDMGIDPNRPSTLPLLEMAKISGKNCLPLMVKGFLNLNFEWSRFSSGFPLKSEP